MQKTILLIVAVIFSQLCISQSELSSKDWISDIVFLEKEIFNTFPDIEERVDVAILKLKLNELKTNLKFKSKSEIVIELQKILALLKDEGSSIIPFQRKLDTMILPIKTYWFSDGLYVCASSKEYKHLLNYKIESINSIDIDSVYYKMKGAISADNNQARKNAFPLLFQIPTWIQLVDKNANQNHVIIKFDSGEESKIEFKNTNEYPNISIPFASYRQLSFSEIKHEEENYWFEFIPLEKTLFIQFLQIRDNLIGDNFKNFVKEIDNILANSEIDKVVIDNRYGGGGNGFKLKLFTDLISKSDNVNKRGKLFVLTSKYTAGTLLELTSILELNTKAIIIGESTAEGPNTVGDKENFELPNSKIIVSLTSIFWPTSWNGDNRTYITPNVKVKYTFNDFMKKVDPWLDAGFEYSSIDIRKMKFPNNVMKDLTGKYKVNTNEVYVKEVNNELFAFVKRKKKSLFEMKTQLYYSESGRLSTDIEDVFFQYDESTKNKKILSIINWKGLIMKVE